MTPQPVIPKYLFKAQVGESVNDWLEIPHNVLCSILSFLRTEASINVAARLQAAMQRFHRADRINQMLEHVHRSHQVECRFGQARLPKIEEACLASALAEAILAKRQHPAADIAPASRGSRSFGREELQILQQNRSLDNFCSRPTTRIPRQRLKLMANCLRRGYATTSAHRRSN